MPITRCSAQKRQTLEEFYLDWANEDSQISSNLGKSMIEVIGLINMTFKETEIYGLTSHAHLLLLNDNSDESDWYVVIIASGDEFHIEYQLPKGKRPWRNATVKGATKSIKEFKDYIIIAMTESEGWVDCRELEGLYDKIKTEKKAYT